MVTKTARPPAVKPRASSMPPTKGKAVAKATATQAAKTEQRPLNELMIDQRYLKAEEVEKYSFETVPDTPEGLNRQLIARALSQPEVRAATAIQTWDSRLDINRVGNELREQVAEVANGSMARPEAMLVTQAHTLDALFTQMLNRSHSNASAGYLQAAETYMRLALKAQSQCRTTIEALSEIKNPKQVQYVRQANIANNQQVNNGGESHARETKTIQSNELSGNTYELLPDTRASQAESGVNLPLETVGELHRAKDSGRKGHQRNK